MAFEPDSAQLLSRLPTHLATDLFASAKPVKLAGIRLLRLQREVRRPQRVAVAAL